MRLSRPKIWMCVLFISFVVLVRYAMRDMQLDVDLLREGLTHMSGIVMEEMRLEREISGDLWRVHVPRLERTGNLISVRSLDVRRSLDEGGEWYFFGARGVYSSDRNVARINDLLGTLETPERVWNLESSELTWAEAEGDFVFPNGLTIYDTEFLLSAPEASMDRDGVVLLDKGGQLQWTRPLD